MKLFMGGARRVWVVGALALGMLIASAGAAGADTVAAPRFRVTTGPLVLSHDGTHYTGTMRVTVRNVGGAPATDASLSLGVPPGLRFLGVDNGGGCVGADPIGCVLFDPPAPGKRTTYTLSFGSYAAAARFARRSDSATVTVKPGGAAGAGSASYNGVLRGTSGTVHHPRPYHPATTYDAVIAAGTPIVEPDGTGGFNVRIPLTVRSRTDAANDGAFIVINAPEGSGFPSVDPSAVCTSGCEVPGFWMAAGESRSFALLFTFRPVGPGPYPVTIRASMSVFPQQPDVTPDDNVVTVDLNIAA